ncbi:MAG: BNR/Asp-box repeat-containing protein [Stygiobacter sp.]|nr:MAG: BNR/Asp-box repeat-containing protein [Stygiobacter sp.]KAF0215285.1 MAG: BNR/Asp-box repeat-containing [Ignavibacteria bacterium]
MKKLILLCFVVLSYSSIQAQWQKVGLDGKSCRDICIHNNKIYVATYSDGVYESNDNGITWTQYAISSPNPIPYSIKSSGSALFINVSNGLYRSLDNGSIWGKVHLDQDYGLSISGQYIYLAIYGGGVSRSSDNGTTWGVKNNGITDTRGLGIFSIGSKVIMGTQQSGLFISEDNGDSWILKNNGIPADKNLRPLYSENQNIWIRVNPGGMYRSTNNGDTWTAVTEMTDEYRFIYKSGINMFTGGEGLSLRSSSNNGSNWQNDDFRLTNYYVYGMAEINGEYFIATGSGVFKRALSDFLVTAPVAPVAVNPVSVTENGFSAKWNSMSNVTGYLLDVSTSSTFNTYLTGYQKKDVGNVTSYSITGLTPGTTYYYRLRAYNQRNEGAVSNTITAVTTIAAPTALSASLITQTNFRASWNAITGATKYFVDVSTNSSFTNFVSGYENKDAGNLTTITISGLQPNTDYFYRVRASNGSAGPNSNIISLKTLSNTQWVQTTGPNKTAGDPPNTGVKTLLKFGSSILAGAYNSTGIYSTNDNANNWSKLTSISSNVIQLISDGTNIYAATAGGGVYTSNNNGTSWQQINNGITNLNVFTVAKGGTNLFAGTNGDGVFISANNGTSWTAVNNGLTQKNINTLLVKDALLFAGSGSAGVFVSNNNGATWAQTTLTGKNVITLKVNNNKIYAATYGGGVYVSSDNGTSWTQINSGITNLNVLALAFYGNTNLFASTVAGIFLSSDSGVNWTSIKANFPAVDVWSLEIVGNYIFAGSSELGVFKRVLSEIVTAVEEEEVIPTKFSLEQNYPNPFNPTTTINYSIPEPGYVTLKVFDVLGNEVATLVDEYKQPGNYNSKFSTHNSKLSSGVYLYTLSINQKTITKKLVLVK